MYFPNSEKRPLSRGMNRWIDVCLVAIPVTFCLFALAYFSSGKQWSRCGKPDATATGSAR